MSEQFPKAKRTDRKVMVTVYGSLRGVVHYSLLTSGLSITVDVYRKQLRTTLRLINRSSLLSLHDIARPHTARQTVLILQDLHLNTICVVILGIRYT